jgi:hypothetical protein
VRSCTQAETEEKRQQKRRKALCASEEDRNECTPWGLLLVAIFQTKLYELLLLGSYPREGPKDNGKESAKIKQCSNIMVNSLTREQF